MHDRNEAILYGFIKYVYHFLLIFFYDLGLLKQNSWKLAVFLNLLLNN